MLLGGKAFPYLEGLCMYLLGRAYHLLKPSSKYNQETSFEYLSKCLKPKFLIHDSDFWIDARYLIATVIIKHPFLVNTELDFVPEGEVKPTESVIHVDSALSHLQAAVKSPAAVARMTDIEFLIAQLNVAKLHHITDR
jgi:hypothetical protein